MLIPKHLSVFLEQKMKEKEDGYTHTNAWWQPNQEMLSRAPPEGIELIAFMDEGPEKWGMNLLTKVLKYSNYMLLEGNEDQRSALDTLIETREKVADKSHTKKIAPTDAKENFQKVSVAFGKLKLRDALREVETLKKSAYFYCLCCLLFHGSADLHNFMLLPFTFFSLVCI